MAVPKGKRVGGRKKGTPNKTTLTTRERIERDADPIGFLIAVQKGEAVKAAFPHKDERDRTELLEVFPTVDQRIRAAELLAKKVAPDMKAIEHSGEIAMTHEARLAFLK